MEALDLLLEKYRPELRRGALVLAVLAALKTEHYGYSLRKSLQNQGLSVDEGTLYPLIRRLEKQGLLTSEWREEDNRKKRFYRLNDLGDALLAVLTDEWHALSTTLNQCLNTTES